ncbi:hypothetical protein ACEPAG_5510 [Sanghuangporus baumii]
MSRLSIIFLWVVIVLAILPTGAYAFGAGSIPNFSYLNDRAFRHGDIAEVLTTIAKSPHHHAGGSGGIADFFSTLFTRGILAVLKGSAAQTFSKSDMRRIYFGNWLRDYSQAMDVAGLSKMSHDTLILIIQVLGFMSFGFTTREFHITPERLGVYLPVEHIDNPKGYADDAQKYDPRLRPPVDPQELEVDLANGMKKYMATEGHTWDTSTAHIRRTLRTCISLGRSMHGKSKREIKPESDKKEDQEDNEERWEAFRLLGSALHTLEDLFAHSNWCEIALRKLGCSEVFCHVGDEVVIRTPAGMAPPLVTGTFGSADFIHSVLGEASDHLSQASIVDLTVHMEEAESGMSFSSLRELLARLPEALGQKAAASQDLEKRSKTHRPMVEERTDDDSKIDLTEYIPSEETQEFIWDVLAWRDDLVRTISSAIESIPGLSDLLDELMDAINECVYTLLSPIIVPLAKEVTLALKEESQAVIDMEQQYEVFDNPKASDPTHSILAKDHVDLILNQPAGRVAKIVVEHTVGLIIKAWYEDEQDIDHVINAVLAAFFHPYFMSEKSKIQNQMINAMQAWLDEFQGEDRNSLLSSLTKQSIRDGKNRRIPSQPESVNDSMSSLTASSYGYDYDSGYDDRRSVSEGEESVENEAPIEHEREAAEEHIIGLRRDYAAVLRNTVDPNTSESAKRHAFEMLRTLRNAEGPREAGSSRTRIDEIGASASNARVRFREPRVRSSRRLVRRKPAYASDDDLSSLSSGFEFKF